jgi:predicted transcriptional regulator
MAIGIVTQQDFDNELLKLSNRSSVEKNPEKGPILQVSEIGEIQSPLSRGRKSNDVNVPESLRSLIAQEHVENGRQSALELAKSFDISSSSVSAYAVGATSTKSYHDKSPALVSSLNKSKLKIVGKARNRLNMALNGITEDKLNGARVRDLASVAKDMSAIIERMEPKEVTQTENQPKFVIFAPSFRDERSYDTIIQTDEE